MSWEKGSAVKSQIFILLMSTPLPNIKQTQDSERKHSYFWYAIFELFLIRPAGMIFKKSLDIHQKSMEKPFFTYNVIYKKNREITW